ncbi:uncharacterized protein Tco025E_09736, partial [Trypanosoma conorhini]
MTSTVAPTSTVVPTGKSKGVPAWAIAAIAAAGALLVGIVIGIICCLRGKKHSPRELDRDQSFRNPVAPGRSLSNADKFQPGGLQRQPSIRDTGLRSQVSQSALRRINSRNMADSAATNTIGGMQRQPSLRGRGGVPDQTPDQVPGGTQRQQSFRGRGGVPDQTPDQVPGGTQR